MALADVRKFFQEESETITNFKNGPIASRITNADNAFETAMWTAWSNHCQNIVDLNADMETFSERKLCRSLVIENRELTKLINLLTGVIMDPATNPGPRRHLIYIRAALCATHTPNRTILQELGSCTFRGQTRQCHDWDSTNPDCVSEPAILSAGKGTDSVTDDSSTCC